MWGSGAGFGRFSVVGAWFVVFFFFSSGFGVSISGGLLGFGFRVQVGSNLAHRSAAGHASVAIGLWGYCRHGS